MGLLSIFSRSKPNSDAAVETDTGDSVARARSRARQRLLGAVVLVGIGIIGFPLLFETQPRPVPVDVPIEIPSRDGVAPLVLPGQPGPQAAPPSQAGGGSGSGKSESVITESAAEAGTPVHTEKAAAPSDKPAESARQKAAAEVRSERPAADAAEATPSAKASDKASAKADDKAASQAAEAARARALLEGKATPKEAASSTRYIVQIGAFADPALARATRLKVERLGLTTYTHVAKTADGERTRVRVGPVASRSEAEKIAEKIKAAGLPTAILTL